MLELMLICSSLLSGGVVIEDGSIDGMDLTPYTEHYIPEDADLAVEDIISRARNFKPFPELSPNFGLGVEEIWLKVTLKAPANSSKYILDFPYAPLDYVTVYLERNQMIQRVVQSGDRVPFSERSIPYRTTNVEISLDTSPTNVWIQIKTESSLQAQILLFDRNAYGQHMASENAGLFFYYGLFLVMLILNLLIYLSLRDRIYLPYILFLFSFVVFQSSVNGTLFQWVLPGFPRIVNGLLLFSLYTALGAGLYFCQLFTDLKNIAPRLNAFSDLAWKLAAVGAFISLSIPYRFGLAITVALGCIVPTIAMISGILSLRSGRREARFYLIAWLAFILGTIIFALKTTGLLPSIFLTNYGMQIGSALEVILLTLALGDRMRLIIADRDALSDKVTEQTESLKVEVDERARVEHEFRTSLEEKIVIMNDATHHLNNPLNHIQQSATLALQVEAPIRENLMQLLSDPSPEAQQAKSFFEDKLNRLKEALDTIDGAIERSAITVELLQFLAAPPNPEPEQRPVDAIFTYLRRRGIVFTHTSVTSATMTTLPPLVGAFVLEQLLRVFPMPHDGYMLCVEKLPNGTVRIYFEAEDDDQSRLIEAATKSGDVLLRDVNASIEVTTKGFQFLLPD